MIKRNIKWEQLICKNSSSSLILLKMALALQGGSGGHKLNKNLYNCNGQHTASEIGRVIWFAKKQKGRLAEKTQRKREQTRAQWNVSVDINET